MKIIDPTIVNDTILAVDIGQKGGVVWNYRRLGAPPCLFHKACDSNPYTIAAIVRQVKPTVIVAENVHIFGPQRGGETLVESRGIWKGIAAFLGINIDLVDPQKWMKCYTHKKKDNFKSDKKWKDHLIAITEENAIHLLDRKGISSGVSDAWMIWNYFAATIVNDRMSPIDEFQFS